MDLGAGGSGGAVEAGPAMRLAAAGGKRREQRVKGGQSSPANTPTPHLDQHLQLPVAEGLGLNAADGGVQLGAPPLAARLAVAPGQRRGAGGPGARAVGGDPGPDPGVLLSITVIGGWVGIWVWAQVSAEAGAPAGEQRARCARWNAPSRAALRLRISSPGR